MSEGRQNSSSDNRLAGNQTETGANLMVRQCRCRCRIKSVIVQLLWVGAQLPTLYNTVEYPEHWLNYVGLYAGADLGFYKGGCPVHLKGAPKAPRPRRQRRRGGGNGEGVSPSPAD